MIECSSCGLMINKNDKKCPRCGHVFDAHKKEKDILTGVGATVSGAGVIAAGVVSHEKKQKNTIKSIKNNALKKSTEKIENTELVKKADSKTTTRTNNQNKKQTSSTAYESKKYNDSLELSESSNSSEGITQEELVNLLERLEEEQENDENVKTILKEFSEKHKGDENLEELLKVLMGDQGNFDDINEMNLEDEDELKSTADSSDMGGDGINISFYSLEQALALLGESSLATGGVTNITSCPGYDKGGGLERVFEKLESGNFTRIKEGTSSFDNYRETIKGFFGENGSGGFVDNLRSNLVDLREKLKEMYTEAEYLEAYNSEMNYRFYDEYGHLDVEKALELYNLLHIDDRKSRWDLSTMSDEEYNAFYTSFSSDERVQNYFSNVEKNILNGVESIESKDYTSTDFYLRNRENGVTEEEVKNHYKEFGDRIAAGLFTGIAGLGLIDLNSGYDGNKTYKDFIDNRVTDGLTGYDTDAQGNKTGEEKADYNGKSDAQKQLEILTYSWYAKDNSHYDTEQYKILSAYVDDYCETKDIDRVDLSIDDHLYQLLQAGASNALWNEDGSFKTRTYFDEETGEMSEQEKIIQRYERAITGGYNENGELDNHRDYEWRINRTTFEESFILSDNYVRKSDAFVEATKNHSELFKVDDETKEIIYDDNKETSEYDENEKELYEIAKKAIEEYKEALDAMNFFGFLVNQSQIDEAKKEAGENYSKGDYPAGVKEYLEYMNSDNKNPYQYMAKYDADNYSDAVEKFGDSMGSKVPHVIEIFSEMPSVKEGRITAEELAKNLSNSLSTNADYYHMYLELVESQHITNVTGILFLAKTRSENYKGIYNVDQQTKQYLEGFGTPEEKEKAIEKSDKDYEKWQSEEQLGKELAQEIGDSQARLSTMSRDIETVQYNKIMAKLPTERTEEEKDFCMRYRIERTGTEQKEYSKQLTELYDRLSDCKNFDEAITLLNNITYTNNSKIGNLSQILESKLSRGEPDFEEKSKSQISEIKVETIYLGEYGSSTIVAYDESGNKIDVSDEELELHIARIAKDNGGKIPFTYRTLLSSNQIKKINYLVENDLDVLTYKLHTEKNIEKFKEDYKHYIEYGALLQATDEYERYVDKLEQRSDIGDWFTTVGYGAKAGLEQFVDGVSSFLNPDGIKSASEYRSMLISSYLLQEYGSDALNSNLMLGTYEISTSMANMMPSVLLSLIPGVGQTLSTAAMFISSAGNAMEQAYQSGATLNQSYVIGLISGALETGLQKTVGGITKLRIKGSVPLGFFNFSEKALAKVAEGSIKYALINYGFNILGEGLEEGTQEFLGPIVENIVKYGIDYTDDFKEWKDYINEMTLEEWQEAKFLEWKAETLSNNTSTSTFFAIKDMTLEEWIKACENGEITDIEGNIIKANQNEFNRLKSDNYTAKDWFNDNKSSADLQSIIKSALYGAISGGIFEGITQFAPEVISYATTKTTVGVNAIMNAVRNQAAQSGESTNLFRNFVETVQIIKDQSNTGKLGDLVAQYIQTPGFQTEYENFINENQNESSNSIDSKIIESLKSIKEKLFGSEENISEVDFATMKVADDLARNSLKNRLIKELNTTTYQSYQELTSKLDSVNKSIDEVSKELENLKSSEQLSDLYSELMKNKEEQLKGFEEQKANIEQTIKNRLKQTEGLQSELLSIKEELNKNNDEAKTSIAQYEQILNTETEESKRARELQNRIDGLERALDNKIQKGEITETGIKNAQKQINDIKSELSKLKKNAEQSKTNLRETIQKLIIEIALNNIQIEEIQSILDILSNPGFNLSSLTVEQFNNFISNLDLNSLQVYAKDIVSRLSDLSDTRISELIEKLDPITLGVFENQIVERVKHITEEEVLNNIKDKNASKFTQNIYEIEVSTDTTTNTTETAVTETVSENTVETEPSTNTRNNNSTETVIRETIKPENETSASEAKKELVSQNAALGTIGLIQMGALTGSPKGNQTLNNVLETIQTDINSLQQRYDSTTINGEVNVETEVNVNEETNSNIDVREELKSQIEQKTKLYNDLTQLMSKYGIDGTELLTSLKEKIISEKYKLEHQLLNTETNIEETINDSIRESEVAIKEIMQQFDLTYEDETMLNEARTAAMYKILEIANKNNISVDSILRKINIDEMLSKNDAKIEIAAERLSHISEETIDDLTEEDIKIKTETSIEKIKTELKNISEYIQQLKSTISKLIGDIKTKIEALKAQKTKGLTLESKMYQNNLLGRTSITVGTTEISVTMYGKNDISSYLPKIIQYLNKIPPFMIETLTGIDIYDSSKYCGDITAKHTDTVLMSTSGSRINIFKEGLQWLDIGRFEIFFHEFGHNIDSALGEEEFAVGMWTLNNQLWADAIEKDGGKNYAPSEYATTNICEDFAESVRYYMSSPENFMLRFPNRAEILQNIFESYVEKIDCSYDKAIIRRNANKLVNEVSENLEKLKSSKHLDSKSISKMKEQLENYKSELRKNDIIKNNIDSMINEIQEMQNIIDIFSNPGFDFSSLTAAQFNSFVSLLDTTLLQGYAKEVTSRLIEIEDDNIAELIVKLDSETLRKYENEIVKRIKIITKQEALDNIKNNSASRFTQDISEINIISNRELFDKINRCKFYAMAMNSAKDNIYFDAENNYAFYNNELLEIAGYPKDADVDLVDIIETIKVKENLEKRLENYKSELRTLKEDLEKASKDEIDRIKSNIKLKENQIQEIQSIIDILSDSKISLFISKFNYEQMIEIIKELKNGILIETLNDLNIERINNGMTIEEIYIERAHNIINSINPKYSEVSISAEFARAIVRNNQQLIKYKENSSYQNRYVENLLKFSPEQLNEINNLFNTISEYEFTQAKISDTQIAELGKIILDSIYDINSLGEQNIKLNMWAINGILKAAPTLTKNISEYNGMITSLISNYFFHNGEYIFIRNQEQLNLYGKDILYGLYGYEVNISDIIKIDGSKIIIDSEFKNIIKNKLNNYETRILYNYLETNIKNRLVPKQKELDNSLYELNKNIRKLNKKIKNKANEIEELKQSLKTAKDNKAQIIAEIRKNASNASTLRNELRVILQNAGFGINVLPKQGTNPLNTNYEGAVINKYISDNLTNNEFITLIKSLKRVTNEIESPEQKEAFRKKIEEVYYKVAKDGLEENVESIKALVKEIVKYDSNLLLTMYQYLNVADFLISYEQMVFDGAFKSNDFVNIALGITSIEQSIFEEKIKSWEEKQDSFSSYTMLNKYNYYKFVKEVLNHGIVKTEIDWPKLGGYLGIPEQLKEFMGKHFDVQEDIYISRYGDKKNNNVSLTLKSSVETVFGNLKDGSLARALPSRYGKDFMEGTINIKKYMTLCDCLYEYLFKENINESTELTLINKLKEIGIEVDTVSVKELIEAYQKAYNTSRTLQDFRIINKDFIKRFIKEGLTSEEFINLIISSEIKSEISDMISDYATTKNERILDDVIETVKKYFIKRFIKEGLISEEFINLIISSEIKSEISDMISDYATTKNERILDDVIETVEKDFIKRFIKEGKTSEEFINLIKDASSEIKIEISDMINNYKATNDESILDDVIETVKKDFIKRFIKEGKISEEFINLIKDASSEIKIEISDMISDYATTKNESILDDVIETVKKDFIKRFIEEGKTSEEFINLIKDASSEIKSEISDMINNYKATNDESILDNIVKKTGSFFKVRMNYDLKYGICGTIASFGDLPGGGSQATLMFSYGLLEKYHIIKDVRSGILMPKGSYLFPKELVENVSAENINSLKKAIYDSIEIENNIIDISSKYEKIDGIIENIKNELKNSGNYTENIEKTIETFKEIMNFNKYIQTHKMTDIVKAIGKLSISEIDNLIENSSYIFELSESTKILNTIENLQEVIEEIPEARRTQVMDKILSKMTIENLQEVIEEIPEARRTQVMDAILVKMIKGGALSQETSDAIFKSKMFDGDSSFAKEYLHHIIEVGIPELGIKGSQELANKISKVYEKARETTKEMSNLHSYCDHTEAHVLQVAFDTVAKGKQIAASKGQTLSETQIKNLFYTGLFHDLGMASGAELGISLETQIVNATEIGAVTNSLAEVIKGLNANVIRENHSLNSALQVLRMREELESLGLNADLIAMMCFSHSKSNSGVGNLSSEGDWSYSVSKIRSALEIMNKASGENITLNLENIGGYETLETTNTDSVQKITKDANGNKIKTKLKVSGIPRITFEEGVLNDLEIMSLAIRMGDAYVTKANVKLEKPIKWVGTDGKTYSTDLLVLTQAGVYMAYDATQTAISTKYKQTDDTETSVESAFIYLRKTKDGKFVPWKDGYGVDVEGKYTNVKDSLMYSEPVKTKDGKILTEEGYYYKEDKTAGTRTYYYKKGNAYTEVETILKERYNEAEEKYGKTLLTSTGKFLVGESNVTYSVEVRGDTLVSIYKIGDIEIFQNNTRSKGIYERLGEIATSRNIKHEVDIRFEVEQFENNFMKVVDRYVGITPIAQEYIAAIKDYQFDYEGIVLKINGVNINDFETNTFD